LLLFSLFYCFYCLLCFQHPDRQAVGTSSGVSHSTAAIQPPSICRLVDRQPCGNSPSEVFAARSRCELLSTTNYNLDANRIGLVPFPDGMRFPLPTDHAPRSCIQVYPGTLMGNRLPDCAVAAASATTADHPPSVLGAADGRSFRDCSRLPVQTQPMVLQHGRNTPQHHIPPSCDGCRSPWRAVNGNGPPQNYVQSPPPQVYPQRACGQLPLSQRFPTVVISSSSMPQGWVQQMPRQQIPVAERPSTQSMSPVRSSSVSCFRQSSMSPSMLYGSGFVIRSPESARLSETLPRAIATDMSPSQKQHLSLPLPLVTDLPLSNTPNCRPTAGSGTPAGSVLRSNTVGRIYQLPVKTIVATPLTETATCDSSSAGSLPTPVSSTLLPSKSVTMATKPVVAMKPVAKAVVTPCEAETERSYVTGRRYTVTKKDGATVEGIWDGKYLTVLSTTAASSTASKTSGRFVQRLYYQIIITTTLVKVGAVVQLLRHRSLASGLSLLCTCSKVDR